MITVLIADDHNLVRKVLQGLLERAGDMQVVAMASDGQEAVEQAVLCRPNVGVMDVSMPCLNGIEATKQICACCPQTRVLMLSMYDTAEYVHLGVQAGALGYVLKDEAAEELVIAVRSVYQGKHYFSKQIAEFAR
jgi:DNA-binding NarL/FixJ family response regulator